MGKALNFIIAATAAVGTFIATGGNIAAAQAVFTITLGVLSVVNPQRAPKPSNTQTSQKAPIPPRTFAYGRSRLHPYYALYVTNNQGTSIDVYAFADGKADGIETVYLNDEIVTLSGNTVNTLADEKYGGGNVKAGWTLGEATNSAFSYIIGLLPGVWTANHRGDGVVTGYLTKKAVKDKYFIQNYPQGDNVSMSLVGRWQLCFDPRTSTTAWTENPVLQLLHYITVRRGYDYATRILPTVQYWIDAANVCDEPIPLRNGGTEPRYRSCVTYDATAEPKAVYGSFLETFDGWFAPRGDGALIVYAGKLYTPTVTIGPDDVIGYSFENNVRDEEEVDQIKVSYVSAEHDWETVETTPWGGEDGAFRTDSISPQSPSFSQNRRLAKRKFSQINALRRGSCTTNIGGRRARGHRYIYLDLAEAGYDPFEGVPAIVEIQSLKRDFTQGGLSFDWTIVDPNIDAWNPATEEGYPAAKGDPVTIDPLDAPTIESATAIYAPSADEGTGTRIEIVANGPDRDDLTWYARYRVLGAATWNEQQYPDVDPGASVILETGFVTVNEDIEVQAAYSTGDGRVSPFSLSSIVSTSTDATAPDAATSITLTNWSDTLDLVTDYIARARSYRWRFYAPDGTTLVRTLITSGRTVSYTAGQAATSPGGARRAYIVKVAGINGAGAGAEVSTGTLSLPAPAVVTGVTATGGATNAEIDFTLAAGGTVAGYSVAYSTAADFDPLTQGTIQKSFGSPTYLQGLAAATFYAKVAAYDAWTDRPDLLNYSTPEVTFTITTGGGGTGSGGGDGGGGYCPVEDEMILMANSAKDGPGLQIRAGNVAVGDVVWTQHETTMQWGAYEIEAVSYANSRSVWSALGFNATAGHKTWLSGVWNRHDVIGVKVAGIFRVVRITVKDAHTYVCAGVLSHNIKENFSTE